MGVWEGKLMEIGTASDIGKSRKINEDSLGYRGNLFVIADGMGGHNAGEIASALAVEEVLRMSLCGTDFHRDLPRTINRANQAILDHARKYPECRGMGTTIAILQLEEGRARVAHVGDSRVYWWRRKKLSRVTRDHSVVEELLLHGGITREEADYHPQRNILTRALGIPGEIEVENTEFETGEGDRILMCTDGLTSMLTDDDIASLLMRDEPAQKIAELLVAEANKRGGHDNISVIVVFL